MNHQSIHLTSGEIASLWSCYINNSMSKVILSFLLKHLQDPTIKETVKLSYDISKEQLIDLHSFLQHEKFAIPQGFSENDVNPSAPWLFTDVFCLSYVNHMARVGMLAYSGFLAMSIRKDVRKFFSNGLTQITSLYNKTTDISLEKGILARNPYIMVPKESKFVESTSYLSKKRPLNAIEISHLSMNILTNTIGEKLCLAFAQTSSSKEIQEFMMRGKEIAEKHAKIFAAVLQNENVSVPSTPDMAVSHSTTKTFSDKLLMLHMSLLSASGTGNYATAAAASQRSDLALNYERLSLEIGKYAKSGADMMIKHGWLEQPPGLEDRERLIKKKPD